MCIYLRPPCLRMHPCLCTGINVPVSTTKQIQELNDTVEVQLNSTQTTSSIQTMFILWDWNSTSFPASTKQTNLSEFPQHPKQLAFESWQLQLGRSWLFALHLDSLQSLEGFVA